MTNRDGVDFADSKMCSKMKEIAKKYSVVEYTLEMIKTILNVSNTAV